MVFLSLSVSAVVVLLTFAAAAVQDWKTRAVYRATWYPAAGICLVCGVFFWPGILSGSWGFAAFVCAVFLSLLVAVFSYLGLFGKADAKALILLSLAVPVTPFAAWIFPSLAVSVIVNAGVFSLIVPVACLLYNLGKKNYAPFWLMCSGRPVSGAEVCRHFGFIAENQGGDRRFVTFLESLTVLKTCPEKNIRNLRENPQDYLAVIRFCESRESVWVTVGIPLLVPLTAGLVFALFGVSAVDIVLAGIL